MVALRHMDFRASMPALMTNENITFYPHDRLMAATVLKLVPSFIRPNHFTVARLVLTPFVLALLWLKWWEVLVPVFMLTAFTDVIDGSLARTRAQITMWGTAADPVADKILIGSVVVLFVAQEINPLFAALIVFLELLIVLSGLRRARRGAFVSANVYGKLKMLMQVLGVALLLLARAFGIEMFVPVSMGTFSLAIVFAIISLFTYGF